MFVSNMTFQPIIHVVGCAALAARQMFTRATMPRSLLFAGFNTLTAANAVEVPKLCTGSADIVMPVSEQSCVSCMLTDTGVPLCFRPDSDTGESALVPAPTFVPYPLSRLSALIIKGPNSTVYDLSTSFQADVSQYGMMVTQQAANATLCLQTAHGESHNAHDEDRTKIHSCHVMPRRCFRGIVSACMIEHVAA